MKDIKKKKRSVRTAYWLGKQTSHFLPHPNQGNDNMSADGDNSLLISTGFLLYAILKKKKKFPVIVFLNCDGGWLGIHNFNFYFSITCSRKHTETWGYTSWNTWYLRNTWWRPEEISTQRPQGRAGGLSLSVAGDVQAPWPQLLPRGCLAFSNQRK